VGDAHDERVVELEVRVAYQDKIIGDLDEVLRAFTTRVEALEREVTELKRTVDGDRDQVGPADEKPPHY
jgi:SlyX protein